MGRGEDLRARSYPPRGGSARELLSPLKVLFVPEAAELLRLQQAERQAAHESCSYTNDRTTKDLSSLLSLKRKSVKKKRADAKDKTSHQALSDALQLAQNAAHARRDQQSQQQQSPSSLPTSVAVCSSNLQSFPKAQTQMLGQQFYWSRELRNGLSSQIPPRAVASVQ